VTGQPNAPADLLSGEKIPVSFEGRNMELENLRNDISINITKLFTECY
jgi:hypothetical protein